ncbi:Rossmann-fold NAD(P)-binding domain-containing protein [Flavobacterium algicola]|uniref:hypothetical protein n=1 Tax=Flavobacterium algicola TaxID=556529 RepID=UPI001EFD3547|nr:hypothetical protein [Flavobacterium algicola]MCG9793762.1 hypothetical protein [Flavobacterium algicola]
MRSQSKTKWVIVSTGMITSFLFREDFGVVNLKNKTVHALASWQHTLTLTSCEDIGKLTIEVLFYKPTILNQVVYVSGETATFEQIAVHLEALHNSTFKRILWDEKHLNESLKSDPENSFHKYRLVFTNPGVSWPMKQTFNHRENIPTVGILEWAKINLDIL